MRLRQIALVARDLEPAVEQLSAVLRIEVGFRDPGVAEFGLRNVVMPVGDTFLEVVSPQREGTTAGRLLERRAGDGGYMVILQTDDLVRERARIDALGVRVVWDIRLEDAAAIHLHPRDVGGAILSFDQMDPPASWRWAGPDWKSHVRTDICEAITGVEIQMSDPDAAARRWGEVLDCSPKPDGSGGYAIGLDASRVSIVPVADGRGEGVRALDVRADRDRLTRAARAGGALRDDGTIELVGVEIRCDPTPSPGHDT